MRYRLRTLLILLAVLPPLLWFGWGKYQAWKAEQDRAAQALVLKRAAAAALSGPPAIKGRKWRIDPLERERRKAIAVKIFNGEIPELRPGR